MCKLWKKRYTCGCISHAYRDRCAACLHSSSTDDCVDVENTETPRKSYFPCYTCLVAEDRREKEEAQQANTKAAERSRQEAEKHRQIQQNRDSQLKMEREKEEELRRQRDLKAEQERKRREGGGWVDAGSTRGRRRGGRNGGNGNGNGNGNGQSTLPARPSQGPPALTPSLYTPLTDQLPASNSNGTTLTLNGLNIAMNAGNATTVNAGSAATPTGATNDTKRENLGNMESSAKKPNRPSKKTGVDPGGRAGHWGPSGRK